MNGGNLFELRVFPVGDVDLGVELVQSGNGDSTVVRSWGPNLTAVGDHILDALRAAGCRTGDLTRTRRRPFALPEKVGVRLGLVLLAVKPLRKVRRIEAASSAVRDMSDDEAYYWFAKCTDPRRGRRAQRAFRDLVSDR